MTDPEREFFAVTPPGLEKICFDELTALGLAPTGIAHGGVGFSGGLRELYLANLWLRTASRILVRLETVTARDFPLLYRKLVRLPWGRYLKPGGDCEIKVTSSNSRLFHTGRIADVCRAAIAKALGPGEQGRGIVQRILLRLVDNRMDISIDGSGDHLHRRGYLQARGAAPLRENLAAGALLAAGYDGTQPLIDVMTGSGTFVIEAALIAARRPPGGRRRFSFMNWPKYRESLWNQLLQEAAAGWPACCPAAILGIDSNPKAVAAARLNLDASGFGTEVTIRQGLLQQLRPESTTGLLIGNPPYGERLGDLDGLKGFYGDLEKLYGETFAGWNGVLVCPQQVVDRMPHLRLTPLLYYSHGGIEVGVFFKPANG